MRLTRYAADTPEPRSSDEGTRRLLTAVLRRALDDAMGPPRRGSTASTELDRTRALGWISDDGIEPMTFRWLCNALDLDVDAVRSRLRHTVAPDDDWLAPDDAPPENPPEV